MPTYEYVCKACGHQLEVVQAFTDAALTICPDCGGELKKVFGNVGIVFKGSGFYKTDSRSSTSATTAGATKTEAASPSGDSSPTTSSSESAPAAAPSPAAASSSDSSGS